MSIEKLSDISNVDNEKIPFTQICNKVISNIKNGDAFLVWCYLQSKSGNWKVIKQNIKNIYGFGDKKLKKIFSYLHRANLIIYVQMHSANGDFAHMDIRVQNGSKFDKNQPFNYDNSGGAEKGRALKGTNPNDELLNKDITKQRKERKIKSYSAPDGARPRFFDEFWSIFPIKKNRKRAESIWRRRKYDETATLILSDVKNRLAKDAQWQDKRYVPHPSNYLTNELWNDEIIEFTEEKIDKGHSKKVDVKPVGAAYLEFSDPRHPNYDQYLMRKGLLNTQ